jgi:predicted aspartyl protease
MGRIITQVRVENANTPEHFIEFSAMVDTGAAYLTLPNIWAPKLGKFPYVEEVEMITATGESVSGQMRGPARIRIQGFRPLHSDILFVEMEPERDNGVDHYEPLLGYTPLEMCGAAVDMLGHRLVPVKYIDLK